MTPKNTTEAGLSMAELSLHIYFLKGGGNPK